MKILQADELFTLTEQYLLLSDKEQNRPKFIRAYHKTFEHIYEGILDCLSNGREQTIHEALQKAVAEQNKDVYELLSTLTLTSIHRFTYLKDEKDYASTLFIIPCLCQVDEQSKTFSHPSMKQIEDIFKKYFLTSGLIEDAEQLHLPGIKIDEVSAYGFTYSDWFELHKQSLIKSVDEIEPHKLEHVTLPEIKEQALHFFPMIITYQCDGTQTEPQICKKQAKYLNLEDISAYISQDVSRVCLGGMMTFGVPAHCENALIEGLELLQQTQLEDFFVLASQSPYAEILIYPQDNCDMVMCVWNNRSKRVDRLLELNSYTLSDEEFIDSLLQQISFYEINKTYIFEDHIHNVNERETLDLSQNIQQRPVIVLEKANQQRHTLH